MRRTVPPSAEIQANIDKLLSSKLVEDPQKMLSELARLGANLIIQRAWRGSCGKSNAASRLRLGPVAHRGSSKRGGRVAERDAAA